MAQTPPYNFSSMPNFGGPSDPLTLRNMFQNALQQTLGSFLPMGLDRLASGMIGDFALKSLGIKYDYAMDVPLTTGGLSSRGVANSYLMTQARQLAPQGFEQAQRSAEFQFWKNIAGLQKSEAQWLKDNNLEANAKNRRRYDDYLANEALGYQNGPASMFYKMLDPYEMGQASQYMSMATGNLYTRQLLQGDRRRPAAAVRFMSELFRGPNGEFAFDRKDYGGMGIGEVSALTAALTKELDPLGNARSGEELKKAAGDFSDKIKEYARALAPLKDVFGQDIPSMLRTVEELSGQSIAATGADRAREIARQVSTGVIYGNYTIGDVRGVNQRIVQQMDKMGMSDMAMAQSALLSVDILDAGTANLPKYMRKDRMLQKAYDRVASSAGSTGAEYLDRAYAMWAQRSDVQDKSIDAFREQFRGVAPDQILNRAMELAGARTLVDLDNGMRYDDYAVAKENRLGGSLAVQAATSERIGIGLQALENRYRNESGGAAVADAIAELRTLADDPSVNILDKDSVKARLGGRWSDAYSQAINLIHASSNDKRAGNAQFIAGEYAVNRNLALARQRAIREQQRSRLLDELNGGAAADTKGVINDLIKGGFNVAAVKERLTKMGITDKETIADLTAIGQMTGSEEEKRDLLRYALTAEGMGSQAFNNALTALRGAKGDDARKTAATDLRIARLIGDRTLSAYKGDMKALRNAYQGAKAGEQANAVKGVIEHELLRRKFGDTLTQQDFKAADVDKSGTLTITEYRDYLEKAREAARKQDKNADITKYDDAIYKLNQISSELYGGSAGTTDVMKIWGKIEEFVSKLNTTLENLNKTVTAANSKEANGSGDTKTEPASKK